MRKIDVLKVDKDCHPSRGWTKDYVRLIRTVCSWFGVTVEAVKKCPSRRKGEHYYIHIGRPVEPTLANRIQWLLGDDCKRVRWNRLRIRAGYSEFNKLFEVPGVRLRTIYLGTGQRRR